MRRLAAIGLVGLLAAAFVVSELVLPGIAAHRIRSQLVRHGTVTSVSVHAFPAIELLWHHADRATITLSRYDASGTGALTASLGQLHDVGSLRAAARTVTLGRLTVTDAGLVKTGDRLIATATVAPAALRDVLPELTSVTPVASTGGALTLRGTVDVFGLEVAADATVRAQDGALVVTPDLPLGGLATVTLFSDPDVRVTGVSATPAPRGLFTMRLTARLR